MQIPQFILNNNIMPELKVTVRRASLNVSEVGPAKAIADGTEQNWKCSDQAGDVFLFTTCELNEANVLGLEAGTVCLIVGPPVQTRVRKKISEAFERFERELIALGARRR